LEVKRGRKA
jgi:hypothetical protein